MRFRYPLNLSENAHEIATEYLLDLLLTVPSTQQLVREVREPGGISETHWSFRFAVKSRANTNVVDTHNVDYMVNVIGNGSTSRWWQRVSANGRFSS